MPGPHLLTEGPFAGWRTWGLGADPYETIIGPFCFRTDEHGTVSAFDAELRHCNGAGNVHGGLLMSFADFCLFVIGFEGRDEGPAVTLSMNSQFLGAGLPGHRIEGRGEVTKATGSFVFVQGMLTQNGAPVMSFNGIIKKIKPRA